MINKIDRMVDMDPEEVYQRFCKVIDGVNAIISVYDTHEMGDITIDPCKGNVAFGSGMNKWAFTLQTFARFYEKKFPKVDINKLKEKLWGENYFNDSTKEWVTDNTDELGKPMKRTFVKYILGPLWKLCKAIKEQDVELTKKLLDVIEVKVDEDLFKKEDPRGLAKGILSSWISAGDTLL
jgi:elongation factor 2